VKVKTQCLEQQILFKRFYWRR